MNIAFHTNQLCLRGTEVAIFDYAHFNERLLGNRSFIISRGGNPFAHHPAIVKKFGARFSGRVFFYETPAELEKLLDANRITLLYAIKAGLKDGVVSAGRKTVIHVVFGAFDPHGNVYAYVSQWLAEKMTGKRPEGPWPFVPHIVTLPAVEGDLRSRLGIPPAAMVFGRHGGVETFNLPFVHQAIADTVSRRKDIHFLMMNTNNFCLHPQIHYLTGVSDVAEKVRFIQSCDAMIHARREGESFGLAVGEFSIRNKPVLTWNGGVDQSHLAILGQRAIRYENYDQAYRLFNEFRPDPTVNYDCYSADFCPGKVMEKFKKVFIDGGA